MKLLTFLGVADYQNTTYVWQDKEYTSWYAPVASCHFLKPDALIVFLTEDAEDKVFKDFKSALPQTLEVRSVPVPLGKNEQELWQIFEVVSGSVVPNEDVAFDITHGLRSFPLLGLLAAAFLRSGLDVSLRAVLYGAYDVRDKTALPHRTPMFDLSSMVKLLEWAAAADRFNRTGDARYLASLAEEQHKQLALASQEDHLLLEQAGKLGNLANILINISHSLRLIRPHQAMQHISNLSKQIQEAQPALKRSAAARPFNLLLQNVLDSYGPLALIDPLNKRNQLETLGVERVMIKWYEEREQWVQAVSLAREWLVSYLMIKSGEKTITKLNLRRGFEDLINSESIKLAQAKKSNRSYEPVSLNGISDLENILGLWNQLTDTRNDILHAGMRENAGKPEGLISRIQSCIQSIENLVL